MMKNLSIQSLLPLMLFFFSHGVQAQNSQGFPRRSAEEVISQMNEDDLDEFSHEEILHTLNQLIENPIDLNQDELNPLLENRLLNELQYLQLQLYRKKRGRIHSVYELEWIEGFDRETLLQIYPFIFVGELEIRPEINSRKIRSIYGSIDLIYKESLLASDPQQEAAGSRQAFRLSSRLKAGKSWQSYFRAEKDAWEGFGSQGFDHYSAYLHWKSKNQTSEAIIGNYQIQSGQGAGNFSGAYLFRSIENPENIRLYQRGIKPYGGGDENNPLQGLAFSTRWRILKINLYASLRNRDAILNDQLEVTSFQNSGLHIDSLSLSRRKNLQEKAAGVNTIFYLKSLHIGFHSQWKAYDHWILTENANGSMERHQQTVNHSLDYQFNKQKINLFGEIFLDHKGDIYQSHGIVWHLHSNLQLAGQWRVSGLTINVNNADQAAIRLESDKQSAYFGAKIIFNSKFRLSLYLDKEKDLNSSYAADHPTEKLSIQARLNWNSSKSSQVFIQYQYKPTSEKNPNNLYLNQFTEAGIQQQIRIQLTHQIIEGLIWQSRADLKTQKISNKVKVTGSMIYQGIKWEVNDRFTIKARYAWFSTNEISDAFSVYEDDLPGLFSNAILYEEGHRFYLLVKGKLREEVICYLRIAESNFYSKQSIGEGIGSIPKNRKPEISVLIRYVIQ